MKANNLKKVVLGLLAALLIYIWWGNIRTLSRSGESHDDSRVIPDEQTTGEISEPLAYRTVKVNPFRRPVASGDEAAQARGRPPEETPPPKLSEVARLTGVVEKGSLSQAVIMTEDAQTFVLSLDDSLVYWCLREVAPTFAVFKQGKYHDTLWLSSSHQ
ncbi:MAG: hypothetical protein OEV68_03735 [candidate division Zixibacteria bacterium]|nr:hypothetical protein [candidate division Zixibacteria bacterium]